MEGFGEIARTKLSLGYYGIAMEKKWFEMTEIRKHRFDSAVWIPLRANQRDETGSGGIPAS
jgi:hypothetical protein